MEQEKIRFVVNLPLGRHEDDYLRASESQAAMLAELKYGELTKAELIDKIGCASDTVTRVAAWGIKAGILERTERHPSVYALTELGKTAVENLDPQDPNTLQFKERIKKRQPLFKDRTTFRIIDLIMTESPGDQTEDSTVWYLGENDEVDGHGVLHELAARLNVGKEPLSRRVRTLCENDYMVIKKTRGDKPARNNFAVNVGVKEKGQEYRNNTILQVHEKEGLNSQEAIDDTIELQEAIIQLGAEPRDMLDITGIVNLSRLELKRYKSRLEEQYRSARLDFIKHAKSA